MDDVTSFTESLPGYIVAEMKTCGKPNCKCARGELHGPYFYRRGRHDGQHWRLYVKREDLAAVTRQCANYRQLQREIAAMRAYRRATMASTSEIIRNLRKDGFL